MRALRFAPNFTHIFDYVGSQMTMGNLTDMLKPKRATIPSVLDITLDEIAAGFDSERFAATDLIYTYINRIYEVNDELHAVLQVGSNVLETAESLDKERKESGRRGPLHGVPIALKDNLATFPYDSMEVSAGSYALLGSRPPRASTVAAKLQKAGAILLDKTNLSEWANIRSTNHCAGWSPRGGFSKGIYYTSMNPQGSSSGSAISAGLGLSFASLGTETDGSLVKPSQASNLVGIKPTVGLVSRDGAIPLSLRQDTIGPMARTVKDAAHILSVIAGKSEHDEYTNSIPFDTIPDYAASCSSTSLEGIRLGIPRNAIPKPPHGVEEAFTNGVKILEDAGATILDNANFSALEEYQNLDPWTQDVVLFTDYKVSIEAYFQSLVENPNQIHSLIDLIEFTKSCAEEEYPEFNVEEFEIAEKTDPKDPTYKIAREKEAYFGGQGSILGALEENNLDALITPSLSKMALRMAAIRGLPIVTVPLGYYPEGTEVKHNRRGNLVDVAPGVPFSMMVYGPAFSEEKLIKIAYALEQLTNVRQQRSPIILPSTDLADIVKREPHLRGDPRVLQHVLGAQMPGISKISNNDYETDGHGNSENGKARSSKV